MTPAQIKDLGDTARKPRLPPGTRWMLRSMEPEGITNSGKWLEVWGWDISWGDNPSHACPVFTSDNIKDDFHWSLYQRFTSRKAEKEWTVCALVEVHLEKNGHFTSTGRMRRHKQLPDTACDYLCRHEWNAWVKRNRPRSRTATWKAAYDILRQILEKGHVDHEGDFLLGDVWPDSGHPVEPTLITRALELYERSEAGPVTISRS